MSNWKAAERTHPVVGLSPLADAFAGTVYTDVVDMRNYGKCVFRVISGGGPTGTSLFTVEACDDTVPTNVSAVAFTYREHSSNDVGGALTAATTAGFTCTAGSNRNIVIEVDQEALISSGYRYVRLKAVEQTDSPVTGCVLIELMDPMSTGIVTATAI